MTDRQSLTDLARERLRSEAEGRKNGADEARKLEAIRARDLCALPDPISEGIIGSLVIPGYRTAIGGATGEGKSVFVLHAIRAAITRGEFIGIESAGCDRALYLDAEQGLRTIKRRLAEVGLSDSDRLDVVRAPDGLSLDSDPRQVAELEALIAAGRYGIVALDPLYKLHRSDSNEERAAVDLMRALDALRERYGFALLLPMHLRKKPIGAKFTMDEFFGSGAYLRGAEIVLGLQRLGDGYAKLHFFKDRDGDLPVGHKWGLLFDRETGFRRDPTDGEHRPTAKDEVEELLVNGATMTLDELEAATGKKRRTIQDALRDLDAVSDGHRPARYSLPDRKVAQQEMER